MKLSNYHGKLVHGFREKNLPNSYMHSIKGHGQCIHNNKKTPCRDLIFHIKTESTKSKSA